MDILAYRITDETIPVLIHVTGMQQKALNTNLGYIAYRNERMKWMLASERTFKANHPKVEILESI